MCFWYKSSYRSRKGSPFIKGSTNRISEPCNINYALKIFISFRGQPHHEIKFNPVPSCFKDCLQRVFYILFRDALVYYVSQALSPRLRGKCKLFSSCAPTLKLYRSLLSILKLGRFRTALFSDRKGSNYPKHP